MRASGDFVTREGRFRGDEFSVDVDLRFGDGGDCDEAFSGFVLIFGIFIVFFDCFFSAQIDVEGHSLARIDANLVGTFAVFGNDANFVQFVRGDFDTDVTEVVGDFGVVKEDAVSRIIGVDDEASWGAIGIDRNRPKLWRTDVMGFGISV